MRVALALLLALALSFHMAWADETVPFLLSNYQVLIGVADSAALPPLLPQRLAVLRTFFANGKPWFLGVDPLTMKTSIHPEEAWALRTLAPARPDSFWSASPYGKVLAVARNTDDSLSDAGLEHVPGAMGGIVLTVDLCPSLKPLDRRLINALLVELGPVQSPVPLAFAITGAWMRSHMADLAWLRGMESSGKIAITWINHTDRHRYIKGLPDQKDFLRLPGTNLASEVLGAEVAMLREGLLPSVFFRFPGLVSDSTLVDSVVDMGLVPVGSDAWLAKNQKAHAGSIVLVHGNGNEPLGVYRFLQLLRTEEPSIRLHAWSLLDLGESVREIPEHPAE